MDAWKRTGTDGGGEPGLCEGSTPPLGKVQRRTCFLDAVCLVLMDPRLGSHVQTFSFHGATPIFGTFLYYVEIIQS